MRGYLELLRPQHRDEEVDQQAQGDDSDEDVFQHDSELSTRVRVNDADREERDGNEDEDDVLHEGISSQTSQRPGA
jgi:hypothetical protein